MEHSTRCALANPLPSYLCTYLNSKETSSSSCPCFELWQYKRLQAELSWLLQNVNPEAGLGEGQLGLILEEV